MHDDTILDVWGDAWYVEEARRTPHGLPVLLGRPRLSGGGRPRQGNTSIPTAEHVGHLRAHRERPYDVDLPVSRGVVKRLRRLLGLSWRDDRAAWWEAHADELADLTLAKFARRHGVSEAAASLAHRRLFGRRLRPAGWWREGEAAYLLRSDLPRAYVAHRLGVSVGTVGRLRWVLRHDGR